MDKRFLRLARASLALAVSGYVFLIGIALFASRLSVLFGALFYLLWMLLPAGGFCCCLVFRRIYGKAKSGRILAGMILDCLLIWLQLSLLCLLLFDGQEWSNTESTALILFLVPLAAVIVMIAVYFSFRKRGQSRVESMQDLLAGVCTEGLPGCFAVLSVRRSEWREETVGAYYAEGVFSVRKTVRYRNSGEESEEKRVDLPEKYAKKHSEKAFEKFLAEQFPEHSFDRKLVAGAYYRMK